MMDAFGGFPTIVSRLLNAQCPNLCLLITTLAILPNLMFVKWL